VSLLNITQRMYLTLMRIKIGGISILIISEEINKLELIRISQIKIIMILITLEMQLIHFLLNTIHGDNLQILLRNLMTFKRNKQLKLLIKLISRSAANNALLHRIKKNQIPPKVNEVTKTKRMHNNINLHSKHTNSQRHIQARDLFHRRINLKTNFNLKNNQVGSRQQRMRIFLIQQLLLTLHIKMCSMDLEQVKCSLKLLG